jgi:hypothetical protein
VIDRRERNRRLVAFAGGPECRVWRVDNDELSAAERVFGAIWELEAEVNNGGLQQFFWNSSGRLAPHVVDALRAIGAFRMASILEQAVALGGSMEWQDDVRRRDAVDALMSETVAALSRLDDAFLAYPDDLTELLYIYVCRHRDELRAPADAFVCD